MDYLMGGLTMLLGVMLGAGVYHVAKCGIPVFRVPSVPRAVAPVAPPVAREIPAPPGPPPPAAAEGMDPKFVEDLRTAEAYEMLLQRLRDNGSVIDDEVWAR
mgnify:CR=1 FL=1